MKIKKINSLKKTKNYRTKERATFNSQLVFLKTV